VAVHTPKRGRKGEYVLEKVENRLVRSRDKGCRRKRCRWRGEGGEGGRGSRHANIAGHASREWARLCRYLVRQTRRNENVRSSWSIQGMEPYKLVRWHPKRKSRSNGIQQAGNAKSSSIGDSLRTDLRKREDTREASIVKRLLEDVCAADLSSSASFPLEGHPSKSKSL